MIEAVSSDVIKRTSELLGLGVEKNIGSSKPSSTTSGEKKFRVGDYLEHYGRSYKFKEKDALALYCLDKCIFDESHVNGEAAIIQNKEGKLFYNCFHDSCQSKTWQDARAAISGKDKLSNFIDNNGAGSASSRETNSSNHGSDHQEGNLVAAIDATVIPVEDFMKKDIEKRPYIMYPWLKYGTLAMITAGRGLGKTWLALSIALGIVTKSTVGRWRVEHPVGVLYIDGEMAADELQDRLKKLLFGRGPLVAPLDFLTADLMHQAEYPAPNLINKEWRDAIYKKLKSGKYKVLILDNLASLTPGIDENDKKEWDPVNQWLISIRHLGIAVIMIHHMGKKNIMRGSSAKEDNLDVSIYLMPPTKQRPDGGARFKVTFGKARSVHGSAQVPFEMQLIEHDKCLQWLVGETSTENKHGVIKALGEGKQLQKDIAKDFDLDPSRITQIKKEAIKEGWLNKTGRFTKAGRKAFADSDTDE